MRGIAETTHVEIFPRSNRQGRLLVSGIPPSIRVV